MRSSILAAALLALPAAGAERFAPKSFQLCYGGDEALFGQVLEGAVKGQIVVIETRALSKPQLAKLLERAAKLEARVLGYLSVGELHDMDKEEFAAFLKKRGGKEKLEEIALGRNETFKSTYMDVLSPGWRAFMLKRAATIRAAGLQGIFLDTVDTADLYVSRTEWDLKRRSKSVEAMISLVREIKKAKEGYAMMNRGLNLIGEKVFVGDDQGILIPGLHLAEGKDGNPDAVLWENAFTGTDDWSQRVEKDLNSIQKSGKASVFALGYKAAWPSPEEFCKKAAGAGFIPAWATSSETLHKEIAK